MAAIGKIRSRGKLLAIVIGASLILFLVSSALSGNSNFGGQDTTVGEVKGEEIPYAEFSYLLNQEYERYSQNNAAPMDEETRLKTVNTIWDRFTVNKILKDEYEALGVKVTEEELYDLVQGDNPHTTIKKYFADPATGQFNRTNIISFLQNMDADPSGKAREQWNELENYIQENQITNKYSNLLKNVWYAPTWEVNDIYNEKNERVNAKFVVVDYNTVDDAEVEVTDADVKAYLAKNPNKFIAEDASRNLEYVQFEIFPSKNDSANAKDIVADEFTAFSETDNDSIFVTVASEDRFNNAYQTKDLLAVPENVKEQLFSDELGTVTQPYYFNGKYSIAKVLDRKMIPDSLKARHILVKLAAQTQESYAAAKLKIDSLKKLIEMGADFAAVAIENSEDPGSGAKGGDLGWVKPNQMVKPFNDACFFKGDRDEMLVVFSQFGFHLIDVTNYKPTTMAAKVAFVSSVIVSSEHTRDSVFSLANNFVANSRDMASFETNSMDLNPRQVQELKSSDYSIPGLGTARGIVRWAYRTEVGTISNVLELDDKYIVAALKTVREKGPRTASDIREEVEAQIIHEKKGKIITDKYKTAFASKDLTKIATETGSEVKNVDGLIFKNPYTLEFGRDIKVAGTIFGLEEGAVSEPIIGEKGVYIVSPSFFQEATQVQDFAREKNDVVNLLKNRTEQSTLDALRSFSNIQDYRYKFF